MATVFALSIQPYINSSIIIQLLTVAIPYLERLAKDGGEEGRKKIASITRYTTVAIAILQAVGYYVMMKRYDLLAVAEPNLWHALVIVVTLIAGSSFVMWMGEQVTEFGVGNGISIILFAGVSFPACPVLWAAWWMVSVPGPPSTAVPSAPKRWRRLVILPPMPSRS